MQKMNNTQSSPFSFCHTNSIYMYVFVNGLRVVCLLHHTHGSNVYTHKHARSARWCAFFFYFCPKYEREWNFIFYKQTACNRPISMSICVAECAVFAVCAVCVVRMYTARWLFLWFRHKIRFVIRLVIPTKLFHHAVVCEACVSVCACIEIVLFCFQTDRMDLTVAYYRDLPLIHSCVGRSGARLKRE